MNIDKSVSKSPSERKESEVKKKRRRKKKERKRESSSSSDTSSSRSSTSSSTSSSSSTYRKRKKQKLNRSDDERYPRDRSRPRDGEFYPRGPPRYYHERDPRFGREYAYYGERHPYRGGPHFDWNYNDYSERYSRSRSRAESYYNERYPQNAPPYHNRSPSSSEPESQRGKKDKKRGKAKKDRSRSRSNDSSKQKPAKEDQIEEGEIVEKIDKELLDLLGEDPSVGKEGNPILDDLASRWKTILSKGLSKETKVELMKKYPTPKNCQATKAPALNQHIKAAMKGVYVKKDNFQVLAQNQLGAGLNAFGQAFTEILKQQDEKTERGEQRSQEEKDLILALADAGKILTDLHHSMSLSRRYFVASGLNPIVKTVADGSAVEETLFGEKFSEQLKSAKSTETAVKSLIKPNQNKKHTSNQKSGSNQGSDNRRSGYNNGSGNWRGPPRQKSYRNSDWGGQRNQYKQSSNKNKSPNKKN